MQRFPFGKKREDCYCCIMTPEEEEEDLLSVVLHFPNGRARMNCSSSSCANREVNRVFSYAGGRGMTKNLLLLFFPISLPPLRIVHLHGIEENPVSHGRGTNDIMHGWPVQIFALWNDERTEEDWKNPVCPRYPTTRRHHQVKRCFGAEIRQDPGAFRGFYYRHW